MDRATGFFIARAVLTGVGIGLTGTRSSSRQGARSCLPDYFQSRRGSGRSSLDLGRSHQLRSSVRSASHLPKRSDGALSALAVDAEPAWHVTWASWRTGLRHGPVGSPARPDRRAAEALDG